MGPTIRSYLPPLRTTGSWVKYSISTISFMTGMNVPSSDNPIFPTEITGFLEPCAACAILTISRPEMLNS